jgi:ABC-type dipeptide/oligopeptide/nickel transport system permease subunit
MTTVQDTLRGLMAPTQVDAKAQSLTRDAWVRLRSNPLAIIGALIIIFFVLVAIFAPWLAPHDPKVNTWFSQIRPSSIPGPSGEHWFGLDESGRDELSRIIYGARASLIIGVVSLAIGAVIGAVIGIAAGAFGGWVDSLMMRFTDILLAVPGLLLALSIVVVLGQSQTAVMIAVAVPNIPLFARLLRSSMLAERQKDYVVAATSVGLTRGSLVFRHILPNDRAGHAGPGHGHHRRGGAQLPWSRLGRSRCARVGADAGQHPEVPQHCTAPGDLPRCRDPDHGAGIQPVR